MSLVRSGLSSLPESVFDHLVSLEELSLAENSLTSLPEGIFDQRNLSFLDLSDNDLASSIFRDGVFESLTLLHTLLLDGNPNHDDVVPTSLAGPDREVLAGETVILDGSGSGGPWGTNVTYLWEQTGGTSVTLHERSASIRSFVAPTTAGDLWFNLDVETPHVGHDNHHYFDADAVRIRVLPGPAVTNVAITSSGGTYVIGDEIEVTVTYTEPVTVTSTPQAAPYIELDIGGRARQARYDGGDGTNALVFAYTVVEGDGGHRRHRAQCRNAERARGQCDRGRGFRHIGVAEPAGTRARRAPHGRCGTPGGDLRAHRRYGAHAGLRRIAGHGFGAGSDRLRGDGRWQRCGARRNRSRVDRRQFRDAESRLAGDVDRDRDGELHRAERRECGAHPG